MKVADLQQHLADLASLLGAAGVKREVVADLTAIRDGLAPFRDLPLKEFADFLLRAETYRSSGEVPSQTKGRAKAGGKTGAKAAAPDVPSIAREVKELFDRAADPSITEAGIDAVLGRLALLDKKGLQAVAEAIELTGVGSKPKAVIAAAIRQRIIARKGSSQRVGLLDREVSAPESSPAARAGTGATVTQNLEGVGSS
jgi:hypothetical protein